MGLTDAEFAQVRRAMRLPNLPSGADAVGRRRSARWSVDGIVAFAPCREPNGTAADAAARWVSLFDLSPTGASVLSKTQLAPGECFVLALPCEGDHHLPAICRVQYSRVKLDGSFRVGAEFCDAAEAGAEKVQGALDALRGLGLFIVEPGAPMPGVRGAAGAGAASARPDAQHRQSQRRSERRMAEGRAVIHTYGEDGEAGPIEEVPALDFSETGVCIFRREPLKVGDRFMARVPLLNASPIISLCRVTNVTPCEGESRYRIGAEFIPLPGIAQRLATRVMKWLKPAA
jgi:hypothetical protein